MKKLYLVLIATFWTWPGCKPVENGAEHVMFFDQSASISKAQRNRWAEAAVSILNVLGFGDSILILPIHDHTLEAGPIYQAKVPTKGVSLEDIQTAKQELLRIRKEAAERLHGSLSGTFQSRSTELFEVIDRLAMLSTKEPSVQRRVYIFSDMLQSSLEMDMERNKVPDNSQEITELVQRIFQKHRWSEMTLQNMSIYCVLDEVEIGKPRSVNSRIVLNEFWQSLFTEAGGRMVSFENTLIAAR